MSDLTDDEVDVLLERFDQTDPALQRRVVAALVIKATLVKELTEACQYAAGSFSQVPEDQTVPPIVLHDCKRKLEQAVANGRAEENCRPAT